MTTYFNFQLEASFELPGNHVIARLSHEATLQSIQEGTDRGRRPRRLGLEAQRGNAEEAAWNHLRPQDCVDEALMESFPASDPPAFTCCHA